MKIIDYKLLAFFCYKFLIMYATIYTWVKATKTTNCIFNTGIFFNLAKSLLIPEKKEYALDDAIKYPCYNLKTTFLQNLKNISPSAIFYKRNACILKKYLPVNSMHIERVHLWQWEMYQRNSTLWRSVWLYWPVGREKLRNNYSR